MHTHPHTSETTPAHGSVRSYTLGFLGSIALTLAAFGMVYLHTSSGHAWPTHAQILPAITVFALLQLLIQLSCFFHFGRGSNRVWNLTTLAFAGVILLIVVLGTLWIMYNLAHNMTAPIDISAYLHKQN